MHGLRVEYRHVREGRTLTWDLVCQLIQQTSVSGRVAVVTDCPLATLSAVRKQWLRQTRLLQVERARTLNAMRILELTGKIARMQSISFSAKPPEDFVLEADITFATADDFVRCAPTCYTMYVTYRFPKEKLHLMTSWMPKGGVVVLYGEW